VNGDDWFWLGALLAQSAMLCMCSFQFFKNARMVERLTQALDEANALLGEATAMIRRQQQALRERVPVELEHVQLDTLSAEARAHMRAALTDLLQQIKRMEH